MNQNATAMTTMPEQAYFLSEILSIKVTMAGKKIGKLMDVIIKGNGTLPVVTHFYVSRPFGEAVVVPWDAIERIDPKEIVLAVSDITPFDKEPDEKAVLLKDHILDKKAIDLDGREMEVVYDIKLVLRRKKLYVSEVDLSRYGLLRRIGLTKLANFIYNLADSIREQTISWTYIQPLPEDIGRFRGDLRLKVLKEKLSDIHPVDLADILEEMDADQRVEIFEELDPEQASDTLEEIDPNVQRDLVESLGADKIAHLIDEMTTGQAADILSVLPASDADDILERLNPDNARKIQTILERQEENILDYATQEYIVLPPDMTAEQAQDEYRITAKGKDVVMYLYILDQDGRLLGVVDIKELLQADDKALLKDIMEGHVHTLDPDSTLKEASEMFTRYDYRAIPITDDDDKILGVVTYRDVVGLKHRFVE
jgi:CBS domain-containing protein